MISVRNAELSGREGRQHIMIKENQLKRLRERESGCKF